MNIGSVIESMLFISGEPMSFKKLSKYTSIEIPDLEAAVAGLAKKYNEEEGGLRILIKDDEVQMVTAGENSKYVEGYLKADIEGELSRAALEVLSVVAYRGPIPRSKIEEIRGVNCSFTLRHLLIRGLVERMENPSDARTYLYRISFDFLKKLGVEKAEDLPRFGELRNKKILEERFTENAGIKETDISGQNEDVKPDTVQHDPVGVDKNENAKQNNEGGIENEPNTAQSEVSMADQSADQAGITQDQTNTNHQ